MILSGPLTAPVYDLFEGNPLSLSDADGFQRNLAQLQGKLRNIFERPKDSRLQLLWQEKQDSRTERNPFRLACFQTGERSFVCERSWESRSTVELGGGGAINPRFEVVADEMFAVGDILCARRVQTWVCANNWTHFQQLFSSSSDADELATIKNVSSHDGLRGFRATGEIRVGLNGIPYVWNSKRIVSLDPWRPEIMEIPKAFQKLPPESLILMQGHQLKKDWDSWTTEFSFVMCGVLDKNVTCVAKEDPTTKLVIMPSDSTRGILYSQNHDGGTIDRILCQVSGSQVRCVDLQLAVGRLAEKRNGKDPGKLTYVKQEKAAKDFFAPLQGQWRSASGDGTQWCVPSQESGEELTCYLNGPKATVRYTVKNAEGMRFLPFTQGRCWANETFVGCRQTWNQPEVRGQLLPPGGTP